MSVTPEVYVVPLTVNVTDWTAWVPNTPAETASTPAVPFCSRATWNTNGSATRTTESLFGPVVSVPSGSVIQVYSEPEAFRW